MKAKTKAGKLSGFSERTSDIILVAICLVIVILVAYPLYYVLVASISNPYDVYAGKTFLLPSGFTLDGYKAVLADNSIITGYLNSIKYTVVGTVFSVTMIYLSAYPLSVYDLPGRKFISIFFIITMYFGGGLVPTYFLINNLGLKDNFLVYIIPNLVNIWNMILMRSYFQSVPDALEESARIDGANYITIFFKIYWPVSTPIIATIALYFGVFHWNDWFMPNIYITDPNLKPMTSVLLNIISEAPYAERMAATVSGAGHVGDAAHGRQTNARSITMATMITSIVPIVAIYPFLQRYFLKGIMIGSIKG